MRVVVVVEARTHKVAQTHKVRPLADLAAAVSAYGKSRNSLESLLAAAAGSRRTRLTIGRYKSAKQT